LKTYINSTRGAVVCPVEAEGQVVDVPFDGGGVGGRYNAGCVSGQVLKEKKTHLTFLLSKLHQGKKVLMKKYART
jgi:hypothetical protein